IVTQGTARRVASEKLRDRDTARSTKIRIALPRSGLVQQDIIGSKYSSIDCIDGQFFYEQG
ncbi:MAG: hypothetical protein M0Z89_07305, partial [Nitrospiraceae bacterium]|nr:hypothetical protein [Nitrospiraceae bacterium]